MSILVGISVVERLKWKLASGMGILLIIFVNDFPNINQIKKGGLSNEPLLNAHNILGFQRVTYGDESAVLVYSLKKDSVFERYFLKK